MKILKGEDIFPYIAYVPDHLSDHPAFLLTKPEKW